MNTGSHATDPLVALAITRVTNSDGELTNPGTTADPELTLNGTGSASSVVQIYNNGLIKTTASVPGGTWSASIQADAGLNSISARTVSGEISVPWLITVGAAAVSPVITSIVNSQNEEIPPDGSTNDTRVTIRGSAQAQQQVEVFDTGSSKGVATVNAAGVWSQELVDLAAGLHAVKAKAQYGSEPESAIRNFVVQRPSLDLTAPSVLEAFGPAKDQLELARLPDDSDVHVSVPQYTGMSPGHTIRVRWLGRIDYFTVIKTVERPGPVEFTIPRDEVIDSIGRRVDVNYSVVESTGGPIRPSKILTLTILPQPLNLVAPTINNGNTTVTVTYPGSLTSHTIAVRWRGVTDRVTTVRRPPGNGAATTFTIPSAWVAENRGRRVLINYSVGVGNAPLIFSQLLRIDIP